MNNKNFLLPLTALFFVLISGCGKNGSNADNQPDEIIPLSTGNSWTYEYYTYSSADKSHLNITKTVTETIGDIYYYDGYEWYFSGSDTADPTILEVNKEDGFWSVKGAGKNSFLPQYATLKYKYPTKLNDRFNCDSLNLETVSLNETVTTPAGTFNCIKYEDVLSRDKYFLFKPGVGLIKFEYMSNLNVIWNQGTDTIWSGRILIDYYVN